MNRLYKVIDVIRHLYIIKGYHFEKCVHSDWMIYFDYLLNFEETQGLGYFYYFKFRKYELLIVNNNQIN